MKINGFTLYELLVTVAILAIALALGIPSLSKIIENTRTKTAALELLAAMDQTRATSVFTGKRTVLAAQSEWHSGWKVFVDADDDGVLDANETVIIGREKLTGVVIKGNDHVKRRISFINTGESRSPGRPNTGTITVGTLTVCPISPGTGYSITLSKGGRSRLSGITKEECNKAR